MAIRVLLAARTHSAARRPGVSNRIVFGSDMVVRARKYIEIGQGEIHLWGVAKQASPFTPSSAIAAGLPKLHAPCLLFADACRHDTLHKLQERGRGPATSQYA